MRGRGIWGPLKKEIWVLVRALLFWGSGVESPLIFYTKKKEKINTNYIFKSLQMSLIE